MTPPSLTPLKLISITSEQSVEHRVLACLRKHGVQSARVSETRLVQFDESSAVDLLESQVKIECLVTGDRVAAIVEDFRKILRSQYDIGFFVADAYVLRPEIFCD